MRATFSSGMQRFLIVAIIAAIVGAAVVGALRSRSMQREDAAAARVVTTVAPTAAVVDATYRIGGFVRGADAATVRAEIGGAVRWVVPEGTRVRRGAVIARIAAAELGAQLAQAQAARQQAEAQERLARRTWDDLKPEVRAQYRLASQQARAAQREVAAYAARQVVRAPYDGVVLARLVRRGDTVAPGAAVARLARGDAREVTVAVPVALAPPVGTVVHVTTDDGVRHDARIVRVAPGANPLTQKADVTVAVADLAIGTYVTVALPYTAANDDAQSLWRVPRAALVRVYDDYMLAVVRDGRARFVRVAVRDWDGEDALVRSDALTAQSAVIVNGAHDVRDGMAVTVAEL